MTSEQTEPSVGEEQGCPEPPSEEEIREQAARDAQRPDPRQPAYDAVFTYIRELGEAMPPSPVHRNAMIWRAVHAALGATPVGRCVSSHCVEGGHILPVEDSPAGDCGPSVDECRDNDRAHWDSKHAGEAP